LRTFLTDATQFSHEVERQSAAKRRAPSTDASVHNLLPPDQRYLGPLRLTMKLKLYKGNGGFTLLEAMIATMILGFVLASVLAVASQSFRYVADMRRTARSSQVLQQKVEDIRLLSWSDVNALPSTFTDPNDPTGFYKGTITKSAYDSYNGTTTVLKVTVSVTWTNNNKHVMTNALSTLVSNGGLNKYIF
jgi:type II secretory pathway pseudopilin PulG